jgi:hypothetical protein
LDYLKIKFYNLFEQIFSGCHGGFIIK